MKARRGQPGGGCGPSCISYHDQLLDRTVGVTFEIVQLRSGKADSSWPSRKWRQVA